MLSFNCYSNAIKNRIVYRTRHSNIAAAYSNNAILKLKDALLLLNNFRSSKNVLVVQECGSEQLVMLFAADFDSLSRNAVFFQQSFCDETNTYKKTQTEKTL